MTPSGDRASESDVAAEKLWSAATGRRFPLHAVLRPRYRETQKARWRRLGEGESSDKSEHSKSQLPLAFSRAGSVTMGPVKTASRNHRRRLKNRTRARRRKRPAIARRACTIGPANCVENYDSIYEIASDPGCIDEPVIRVEPAASETLYYHRNQQYSVTALMSSTGAVVERYAYTAYGEPKFLRSTGTVLTDSVKDNRFTYTGRERDESIGLYHFRARMYDGESGGFCGRDPLMYIDGLRLYAYAKLRPLHWLDFTGLKPVGVVPQVLDFLKANCKRKFNPMKKENFPGRARGTTGCVAGKIEGILSDNLSQDEEMHTQCGFDECTTEHEADHVLYYKEICGEDFCKGKSCEENEYGMISLNGRGCGTVLQCPAYIISLNCMVPEIQTNTSRTVTGRSMPIVSMRQQKSS